MEGSLQLEREQTLAILIGGDKGWFVGWQIIEGMGDGDCMTRKQWLAVPSPTKVRLRAIACSRGMGFQISRLEGMLPYEDASSVISDVGAVEERDSDRGSGKQKNKEEEKRIYAN
ncbi:hypothetical protein BHE74_00004583 [Ensete ventricosum]|nr:hypothetical protein BHE74_00004583 [Ensete ventricosum]